MQTNLEASLGCLQIEASVGCPQNKAHPYQIQDNENSVEDFPELKNGQNDDPGSVSIESASSLGSDSLSPPDEGYYKPMHHQAFCMWSTFHPDFHKLQQNQWNGYESFNSMNREHHFPNESRVQYLPFRMFSQCHPPEFQFQDFQYFVVIDFEATCDKDRNPHPQEIIEFPSVLVNSVTGQLEASFQTYVRPVYHQNLSEFCKELTGIQQAQVDRGVPLSEALLMHDKWLEDKGIKHTNFAVVTWSNWDCRVMLESECRFKHIRKPPYFNRWINLKVPFNEVFGGVRCNLKEAVQLAGLAWEGRAHCGLDDARNTARLLTHIMHRGFRFAITNSLVWHTSEHRFPFHSPDRPPMLPSHFHHKPKPFAMPFFQFYPRLDPSKARGMYCFCGVKSSKRMVRKPGPDHGSVFFGCGNWTGCPWCCLPVFRTGFLNSSTA